MVAEDTAATAIMRPEIPAINTVNEEVVAAPASKRAADPSGKRRTIVIAVDESQYSDYAFHWAFDNLIRESDEVVILNVRPFPPRLSSMYYVGDANNSPYPYPNTDFDETMEKFNKEASHELIRSYASKMPKDKTYHVRGVALRGDARDEIAYKAEELGADILVIGSRGLGAFKRAIFGSVSDYLLHHCHIPVIVPRMPVAKEQ